VRVKDAGWNQMKDIRLLADADRVACIGPSLVAGNDIGTLRKEVDDFSFSFIAPLGADNNLDRHRLRLSCFRQVLARSDGVRRVHVADVALGQFPRVKVPEIAPPARPPRVTPQMHAVDLRKVWIASLEEGIDPFARVVVMKK